MIENLKLPNYKRARARRYNLGVYMPEQLSTCQGGHRLLVTYQGWNVCLGHRTHVCWGIPSTRDLTTVTVHKAQTALNDEFGTRCGFSAVTANHVMTPNPLIPQVNQTWLFGTCRRQEKWLLRTIPNCIYNFTSKLTRIIRIRLFLINS